MRYLKCIDRTLPVDVSLVYTHITIGKVYEELEGGGDFENDYYIADDRGEKRHFEKHLFEDVTRKYKIKKILNDFR